MTTYRAAWVLPIDRAPIQDGFVTIVDGRISSVGSGESGVGSPEVDLGNAVLLPGLINAHVHLELSWLRGRIPPAAQFPEWVRSMFATRGRPDAAMSAEQISAIDQAIAEVQSSGTVAVGDISNSLTSVGPMRRAGLDGIVFHELLGFQERNGALVESTAGLRASATTTGTPVSLAPHAPYSTSPELFTAIRAAVNANTPPIMSVHLGESPEEVELLQSGSGAWRGILEFLGLWRDDWAIPGCDPVAYLDRHGLLDARTLVVHGVQFTDAALERLRGIGATLVTCPRSNRWVGVGDPPVERFYRSGVHVAVGTDSLASVGDLNLFSELAEMRRLAPSVPASRLLESATLTGARALGLDAGLGSLTPGKHAKMIAVELPAAVADVEECLVRGISPERIERLSFEP